MKNTNLKSGFTLIELTIIFAITAMLISTVISSFSKVGGTEALDTSVMSTVSVLIEAKSKAISSKDAANYGVKIYEDKLVSYECVINTCETKTNFSTTTISNLVTISTSTGIGSDIIFNNVSGSTAASGTITITVLKDVSKKSTINIYNTGVIEKN